jgi:hypothetical protein
VGVGAREMVRMWGVRRGAGGYYGEGQGKVGKGLRHCGAVGGGAVPIGSGKRGGVGMRDGGGRTQDVGPILD